MVPCVQGLQSTRLGVWNVFSLFQISRGENRPGLATADRKKAPKLKQPSHGGENRPLSRDSTNSRAEKKIVECRKEERGQEEKRKEELSRAAGSFSGMRAS